MTLERRTPLKPGRPLARTGGLSRKGPIPRATELRNNRKPRAARPLRTAAAVTPTRRPRQRDTGPSQAVRDLVTARDRGRCVLCGAPATNIHHRRNRGMGGRRTAATNSPANLLSLCGSGTTGCHGWITERPLDGQMYGWSLSTNGTVDPAEVPVWDGSDGSWWLLDHDGGRHRCPPPGETR